MNSEVNLYHCKLLTCCARTKSLSRCCNSNYGGRGLANGQFVMPFKVMTIFLCVTAFLEIASKQVQSEMIYPPDCSGTTTVYRSVVFAFPKVVDHHGHELS